MGIVAPQTESFIEQATALSPERLQAVHRALLDAGRPRLDAGKALSRSAALQSTLDRRVREPLRPRADELDAVQPALFSSVIRAVEAGALAIQTPAALTPEQYRLLTGAFADAGVAVPPHPEESA